MATVKKPGPPVPPRPQHTSVVASLLKTQRESVGNLVSRATSSASANSAFGATTSTPEQNQIHSLTTDSQSYPVIQKKPQTVTPIAGRTVIYKSPSMSLQKKQEEREKRSAVDILPSPHYGASSGSNKLANGAPKPPLKLRKAPDVPITKPRTDSSWAMNTHNVGVEKVNSFIEKTSRAPNNIVIVQSSNGVNLNRHNSMSVPKPTPIGLKDSRLSLGRADFEQVGKIQIDQLQPGQPLPKPRKIVKMPVATLDMDTEDEIHKNMNTHNNGHSSGVSLFRRSKTTLDSLAARASVSTISTSNSSNGFLSGKTVEIKNNLKNAAERLFAEIIVNQHKHAPEPAPLITKHERAVQHQALLEQELATERQKRLMQQQSAQSSAMFRSINGHSTDSNSTEFTNNNCTRISVNSNSLKKEIAANKNNEMTPKKTAFHEILISELAAMRARSSSMENLQSEKVPAAYIKSPTNSAKVPATATASAAAAPSFKLLTSTPVSTSPIASTQVSRKRCNSLEDPEQDHDSSEDVDADNVEDAIGDEEDTNKQRKCNTNGSPRKRCPSGCSSDSSPYGTERSSRIRTSDWIEVGDNGKQVTLTSCHISLEDSGLEDEERIDEMSSSGVGDSWDSVKDAENEKRSRSVKRVMSITDLPPLPKSLSGINQMLGSDSGHLSDADAIASRTNDLETEKENNKNKSNTNNSNNSHDKFINGSVETGQENDKCPATLDGRENGNGPNSSSTTTTTTNNNNNSSSNTSNTGNNSSGNGGVNETMMNGAVPGTPGIGTTLDTQLATLKKEMYGLRQLDLSLLSQLWALNDSIQEFRNMLQEQEQDMDQESYNQHSASPSSYEDSTSSEAEPEPDNDDAKQSIDATPKIITTQPKLANIMTVPQQQQQLQTQTQTMQPHPQLRTKPPLPKALDSKTVPRMRSAPPPPPTNRKAAAPPRPT